MSRAARRILFALAWLCGALAVGAVAASTLIDTGAGPSGPPGLVLVGSDNDPFGLGFAFLGAQFVLTTTEDITGIQGWMAGEPQSGSGATIALRRDSAGAPGTALFSGTFAGPPPTRIADWYGVNGVSWILSPGTYWATFEVRAGQRLFAFMPYPVPMPLALYAFENAQFSPLSWTTSTADLEQFGVRVEGFAVPEPSMPLLLSIATMMMLLAGLLHPARKDT